MKPEGLLCAFSLAPVAEIPNPSEKDPSELCPRDEAPLWLHFSLLDNRSRRYLRDHVELPEEAREALLGPDARARAQAFSNGFVVFLGDFHRDFSSDPEAFGALRVYVSPYLMLTCRKHPLKSVERIHAKIHHGDIEADSPLELFDRLLACLVEGFVSLASDLADSLDDAEDRILAGRIEDHASQLGQMRRLLARLRRYAGANRTALAHLPEHIAGWTTPEERLRLREIIDRFDSVGQDLDLVTERARLLQEEIAARLNEATNRNLYVLSIVTVAFAPITLITGVFGMNVGGLPFSVSHGGFWVVVCLMVITVLSTLAMLRRAGVL
ncbi:MAG TPA: CorA family divalent cation transporter [Polyangiaceae bacterium]|nr:CorA family divalent cation transporter [Polyangiaceae bacterium]